jgi:biofilm protein TabA
MKKFAVFSVLLAGIICYTGCKSSKDPASWSNNDIDKWFRKLDWLNGWNVTPDTSINKKEFAFYYFRNKVRWDRAFTFLKENDLSKMELKRYSIDGDNLYATVGESLTKNEEDAKFEAHRKYIDIQYVINGAEKMSIAPISMKKDVLIPYDPSKDVEFMTVNESFNFEATPGKFYIFFPSDIHRPSVKIDENKNVRKVVVKIKID